MVCLDIDWEAYVASLVTLAIITAVIVFSERPPTAGRTVPEGRGQILAGLDLDGNDAIQDAEVAGELGRQ